jgi:hypothetical protein
MGLTRSDDQLEISMLGISLLEESVDLTPMTPTIPRRGGERSIKFEHELRENGGGNGQDGGEGGGRHAEGQLTENRELFQVEGIERLVCCQNENQSIGLAPSPPRGGINAY